MEEEEILEETEDIYAGMSEEDKAYAIELEKKAQEEEKKRGKKKQSQVAQALKMSEKTAQLAQKKLTPDALHAALEKKKLMARTLVDWEQDLAEDCQVYVHEGTYLAKRFDQINYEYVSLKQATEIATDNAYMLLRHKYFKGVRDDETEDRIYDIVKFFIRNLRSSLIKITFDKHSNRGRLVKMIPDHCQAFADGVYDFKNGEYLFKYDVEQVEDKCTAIYNYNRDYIIFWYFNYDFIPLGFKIGLEDDFDNNVWSLKTFFEIIKKDDRNQRNLCFELMYNISHNFNDVFEWSRFVHLCKIMGYLAMRSMSQMFVMLIGAGGNGKNSLFDGCFTRRVLPKPTSISLNEIEEGDKFVTGSFENHYQNIYLESNAETYTKSKVIKQLTGSMDHSVQQKGVDTHSATINCKHMFSGNDRDNVKFSDGTDGFRRRVNLFEIHFRWDKEGNYLKRGDYYRTDYKQDLSDFDNDVSTAVIFVYFAMYGICMGTKGFDPSESLQIKENDWNNSFSDGDFSLRDKIEKITLDKIIKYLEKDDVNMQKGKSCFYDTANDPKRLYQSKSMEYYLEHKTYEEMVQMFKDQEIRSSYFAENDIYISLKLLKEICGDKSNQSMFTANIRKIYTKAKVAALTNNDKFIMVSFANNKIKVRNF